MNSNILSRENIKATLRTQFFGLTLLVKIYIWYCLKAKSHLSLCRSMFAIDTRTDHSPPKSSTQNLWQFGKSLVIWIWRPQILCGWFGWRGWGVNTQRDKTPVSCTMHFAAIDHHCLKKNHPPSSSQKNHPPSSSLVGRHGWDASHVVFTSLPTPTQPTLPVDCKADPSKNYKPCWFSKPVLTSCWASLGW